MLDNLMTLAVGGFVVATVLYVLVQYASVWSNLIVGLLF